MDKTEQINASPTERGHWKIGKSGGKQILNVYKNFSMAFILFNFPREKLLLL